MCVNILSTKMLVQILETDVAVLNDDIDFAQSSILEPVYEKATTIVVIIYR